MTKNYSFEDKRKKLLVTAVIFSVLGGWLWYMSWASGISHNTILKKSVPEWMTYISLGVLIGTIFVMRAFYLRTFNKTLEYIASAFLAAFALGLY